MDLPKELMMGLSPETDEIWVHRFDEDSALKFRTQLMNESKKDPQKPIVIYIDSYGGLVDSLAAMIEAMDETPNPLITVCHGKAMSCGAILLSHGDLRFCGPQSSVMVHEVSGGAIGDVHDMAADAAAVKQLNRHFMGLLARNCNIKGGYEAIRKMIKERDGRNHYMTADEAVKFGIADWVGTPRVEQKTVYSVSVVPTKKRTRSEPNKTQAVSKKTKKKI